MHCDATFSPPTQTALTTYRKVNYTIVKSEQALYLVSCTQTWKPDARTRMLAAMRAGQTHDYSEGEETIARGSGKWSDCSAFGVGAHFTLTILSTADARLEDSTQVRPKKPTKLDYLGSAAVPAATILGTRVHVTSSPSGGEIYIDGKFLGSTPSDITLPAGQHAVRIIVGSREWSRPIEITAGEISVHADFGDGASR